MTSYDAFAIDATSPPW